MDDLGQKIAIHKILYDYVYTTSIVALLS